MNEDTPYFDLLPLEMVEYLFSFLTSTERRLMSRLSRKFLCASYHFPQDWALKLHGAILEDDQDPGLWLASTSREFYEASFEDVREMSLNFLLNALKKVKILKLVDTQKYEFESAHNGMFYWILDCCPHLEELYVEGNINIENRAQLERLKQVKKLTIRRHRDIIFDNEDYDGWGIGTRDPIKEVVLFLRACPNVSSLDISGLPRYIQPPAIHQVLLEHPTPITCFRASGDFFYFLDQCLRVGPVPYIETGQLQALTGTEFSIGCPYVRSILNVLEQSKGLKELDLTVANRVRLLKLLRSGIKLKNLTIRQVVVERSVEIEPTLLEIQPELESLSLEYNYDDNFDHNFNNQPELPAGTVTYPNLKKLHLFSYLSDRLWTTCRFPNLTCLELEHCRVEHDLLEKILPEFPLLEKLTLTGLQEIKIPIFTIFKRLTHLRLAHINEFGSALLFVPKYRKHQMKSLDLSYSKAVNNKVLEKFVKSFSEIVDLDISGCNEVTIPGLMAVDRFGNHLQCLKVENINIQYVQELLTNQFPLKQLRFLHLGSSYEPKSNVMSDAVLAKFFTRMEKLRAIYINGTSTRLRHEFN